MRRVTVLRGEGKLFEEDSFVREQVEENEGRLKDPGGDKQICLHEAEAGSSKVQRQRSLNIGMPDRLTGGPIKPFAGLGGIFDRSAGPCRVLLSSSSRCLQKRTQEGKAVADCCVSCVSNASILLNPTGSRRICYLLPESISAVSP